MKNTLNIIAVTCIGVLFSCTPTTKQAGHSKSTEKTITVFAAASLTNALSEMADSFEMKYKVKIKTSMASSGTLARQIEQGGEPDIYISASKKWAGYIDSLGYILKGYKSEIAQNDLVLIAPINSTLGATAIDSSLNIVSLLGKGRLSMGDPSHVPAGKYAKQSLNYYGWNPTDTNILPAKDARSALMVVEMEEAPIGIVYKTDAAKSKKVKVLSVIPEKSHMPIVFVAEVCQDNKIAKDFFTYLKSGEAKTILTKHGFK